MARISPAARARASPVFRGVHSTTTRRRRARAPRVTRDVTAGPIHASTYLTRAARSRWMTGGRGARARRRPRSRPRGTLVREVLADLGPRAPRLLDGALVLDRRHVARVALEDDRPEDA